MPLPITVARKIIRTAFKPGINPKTGKPEPHTTFFDPYVEVQRNGWPDSQSVILSPKTDGTMYEVLLVRVFPDGNICTVNVLRPVPSPTAKKSDRSRTPKSQGARF